MANISLKGLFIFLHPVDLWILFQKKWKKFYNILCYSRFNIVVYSCMLTTMSAPAKYSMTKWVPDI